jgi:hypothetical protein
MGGVATPFSGGFVPPGAPGSPEAGGGPVPPQPQTPGMDALLGQSGQQGQPSNQDPQGVLRAKMMRYREAEQLITALAAAEGSDVGPEVKEIKNLLRKMMQKAVSRPGAVPEPPAPQSLG